jgi:hypothetical protein
VPVSSVRMTSAVSSGRFQYPCMTWGPATVSSPGWPGGSSVVQSSGSTTRQTVSGSGMPTVPGLRVPLRGFPHTVGEASVRP